MASFTIIIPVLNEGSRLTANLLEILSRARQLEKHNWKLVVVDDGSSDDSVQAIVAAREQAPEIDLICFTRRFGKESAIHAGLLHCRDIDAAIVMDSDLQHPPQLIAELVRAWESGAKVVNAIKVRRGKETHTRNLLTRLYFALFKRFTRLDIKGDTDFKLLDQEVIRAYRRFPESERFFRGLVRWMHFHSRDVEFDVPEQSGAAKSSWSNPALLRYALSSITSFTALPLQIVTLLGGLSLIIAVVFGSIALFDKITGNAVDGFTTVILLILLLGSILMISVGLIGTYIGKIYDEVKRRPSYFIDYQKSSIDDDNK